jgi:signal transduction histidine kinase
MSIAIARNRSPWHVGKELLARPTVPNHVVQFYESEEFLSEVMAAFLGGGLAAGEPVLVIATEPHREAFKRRLDSRGFAVSTACESGQLTLLDARDSLSKFMVGGMPDPDLFKDAMESAIEKVRARSCHARVRVYGEMVDLLWKEGYPQAAIRLEELWNEIVAAHSLSLLCAYDMDNFGREEHAPPFLHICRSHTHVIPSESYSQLEDPDARLAEVTVLQQRARALESEIAHRKQVENELREALRARDEFLLVAGHELRTPLTAMRLHFQCRPADSVELPVRTRLQKVARQLGRLSTLIEDLLDVSRIRAGRLTLQLEEFDLSALARETVDRAADAMARADCRCRVLAEEPVMGTWDRVRIEQVVVNLLSNAMKYSRGSPIEVAVGRVGDQARIVVRDRGIGISIDDQARIFNRFERACSSREFGGLGLGLWITRQVVESHRGTIRVESELGKGATFVVELPGTAIELKPEPPLQAASLL